MALPPLRILLVNRHLNIGGVETYLCRLTAGLTARGHTVGLLTEGGRYESWAEQAGARLHRVTSLRQQGLAATAELRRAGYQLVHAHNYHSARIGRRLAAALDVPYLMSVHGPRPRLKQLFFRDWSPAVVVMSEGDRDNIRWWGGAGRRPLLLSFYGIDTDRFRPGLDAAALRHALDLLPATRIIAFVSRFSNRKADVGLAFLAALPRLAAQYPDVRGLIVGEGPEAPRLAAEVQRTNTAAGRELARLLGPRTDVEQIFALSEIAICTANTALESLACGTPTIAAGRTGYFGPVGPANFDAARALCFADHGRAPSALSPDAFVRDLGAMLTAPIEARSASRRCAQFIATDYSVARMAETMEGLYGQLLSAPGRPSAVPSAR